MRAEKNFFRSLGFGSNVVEMQNLDFSPLSRPSPAQPEPVESVLALCNGDIDAAELIHGMWSVVDLWDDVVDRDYDVAETRAATVFQWMLFELPRNRLWRENATLHASMRVTIANWQAANVLERSGEREQVITAYTLRCSPYDFFVAVVLAVAGTDAAARAALHFRALNNTDRLEDYLAEHLTKHPTTGDRHGMAGK